jgi:hypothetical protein
MAGAQAPGGLSDRAAAFAGLPGFDDLQPGGNTQRLRRPPGSSPFDSPEYGNWSRVANTQTYKFRDVSYGYDANGTFTGRGEITATATLDADADSMKYVARIDIYDAQGNLVFSACGRATGTRFK